MHKIFFRGKDEDGVWQEGFFCMLNENHPGILCNLNFIKDCGTFYPDFHTVDPETIGQYIGLDRNGTEIFEGDVVNILVENEEIGVVEYEDGCFTVRSDGFTLTFYDHLYWKDVEVIGNIYDNPELLGGK